MFAPIPVPNIFYPPQYGGPYQTQYERPPVIQHYSIYAGGPTDDHARVGLIYEDILPQFSPSGRIATLNERLSLHNYLRSTMFSNGDGKDVSLDGTGKNSVLEHLKFMDLNPYNTYKFSLNPYKGLPSGFLIYRSCYPIRLEGGPNVVQCAKNSIGMNIRIYKLLNKAYDAFKTKSNLAQFDQYREIMFYEFIRESILKKSVCPNFINLFGYNVTEKSRIDFDKIERAKGVATLTPDMKSDLIRFDEMIRKPEVFGDYLKKMSVPYGLSTATAGAGPAIPKPGDLLSNPEAYSGRTLIAMTEAPMYTIFGFASKTYENTGNVRKMINSGFHNDNVWMSIIFQIMVIFDVLQKNGIIINNFDIESNLYVKDLSTTNITGYWKYKIDNIDFYVPNYGYLVLFDLSYKDMASSTLLSAATPVTVTPTIKPKLEGSIFGDTINETVARNHVFELFKTTLNANNLFSAAFIANGGCKPNDTVLQKLKAIFDKASTAVNDSDKIITNYIIEFMNIFVNNRVGTYLKETEVANVRRDMINEFKRGQIVVELVDANTYKFAIILSDEGLACNIITKDDANNIITRMISKSAILAYSRVETVQQTFKPGESNLNEEELLETYIL